MSIQILGFKSITALPAGAEPELDEHGFPLDESITRAYTPTRFPRALDGLEGGQEEDPLEPGHLGSRWYQLGEGAGATFNMSSSRLTAYRDELLAFSDRADGRPLPNEYLFQDLIEIDGADAMIGPVACRRLAAAFRRHPWVDEQHQIHEELNEMIHEIAEHGGCLIFQG